MQIPKSHEITQPDKFNVSQGRKLFDFQLASLRTKLLRKNGGCPKSKEHAPHPYPQGAHSYFLEQVRFQERETFW